MNLTILQRKIGYNFRNELLLKQALTHRSYINENRNWPVGNNERLEFLGDSVLGLIISSRLYQDFPNKNEGELTMLRSYLVNKDFAVEVATEIEINNFLFLSLGESKDMKARNCILADCLEAIIGAIYQDSGYKSAEEFVKRFFILRIPKKFSEETVKDPKSRLQEITQWRLRITPRYRVLTESGADHDKHFLVGVYVGEALLAQGEGPSKSVAEKKAADNALLNGMLEKMIE